MYSVGNAFHLAAKGDNRQVVTRATFNDKTIVNGDYIKSLSITSDCNGGDTLTLGNTCSSELSLEMYMPDTLTPTVVKDSKIFIEVGFLNVTETLGKIDTQLYVNEILMYLYQSDVDTDLRFSVDSDGKIIVTNNYDNIAVYLNGNQVEIEDTSTPIADFTLWIPMGVFYVDDISTIDDYRSVSIKAYDGMSLIGNLEGAYENELPDINVTVGTLIADIANKANLERVQNILLPNASKVITNPVFTDKTYKVMLGYFAGMIGGNAYFTRDGKLSVKGYNETDYLIEREQQYLSGLKKTTDDELTVTSVTSGMPGEAQTVEANIQNFVLGHLDFTNGEPVDGLTGDTLYYFYSDFAAVVPGITYTLSRSNSVGTAGIFLYDKNQEFIGSFDSENVDEIFESTNVRVLSGETSWKFKILNTAVRYIRVQSMDSKHITDNTGDEAKVIIDNNYILKYTTASGRTISIGSGYGISFPNPYVTSLALLQGIYNKYANLKYQPATVKYRGDPTLDVGDIVQVESKDGIHNMLITSLTINISGGMNSTITSVGQIDSQVSMSNAMASGNLSQSLLNTAQQFKNIDNKINGNAVKITALEKQIEVLISRINILEQRS